jgi:Uma2 family endonuclease
MWEGEIMATVTEKLMTSEELLRLPRGEFRYELLDGVLHTMSPAGFSHGVIANKIGYFLTDFVLKHKLGLVLGAEAGYLLRRKPDSVRAPDASFVSTTTLARIGLPARGYFPGAPDLAVEVLSPDDRPTYVA